ncbi:MAG: hypothetical protein AAGE05_05955 [Pseudomonadota bacterium]
MTDGKRNGQLGGGVFLAIGPFAGLAAGWALGEPSIGLLAGLGVGAVLAVGIAMSAR